MAGAETSRPAWLELSDPRTLAQKGETQEYYDHPRLDLLELLKREPRVVLDVGCGGAATGLALKKRFPKRVPNFSPMFYRL